jgi:hypothetical protein
LIAVVVMIVNFDARQDKVLPGKKKDSISEDHIIK